ncbi:MAG: alpha/beta fold hydrolase, partial [Bacteroidota bacterium]
AAPKLELLEATRDDSPIATYVAKRGGGIHHLAFEVADLEAEMARIRDLGIRLLADAPKPGADGKRIVFLHPKDTAGVLVELVQTVAPAIERTEIPFGEGHLGVRLSGEPGRPVLLALHGALGTADQLTPLLDAWSHTFRVVAPDLPGHGASDLPEAVPTWDLYADATEAVLDALEIEAASGFGYSLGAGVLLALAARAPGRIVRLALHATNVQWTDQEVARMTADVEAASGSARGAERLEAMHGARWRASVDAMLAFSRSLPEAWLSDDVLARVEAPALVSAGDRDALFVPEAALHLARTLPDARLWVLPEVEHPLSTLDAPAFAASLADHLGA